MQTVKKTVHQLVIGDIVYAHGCKFKIVESARESQSHRPRNGITPLYGPSDVAWAKGVCIEGYVRGYIRVGGEWTFQGNFLAGQYTVDVE